MRDTAGELKVNSQATFSNGPLQRRARVGRPTKTYPQQFSTDIGYCLEDMSCQKRLMMETSGKRGLGKSMLVA